MLMPSEFEVRLAKDAEDLWAVQRLRYDVFVRELGASGPAVNHDLEIEADAFDAHSEHLMVLDRARGADLAEQLVGVYRMMTQAGAEAAGGFYTASEFDLAPLVQTGRPMMELGRSCLRKPYRGGAAMFYLWPVLPVLISVRSPRHCPCSAGSIWRRLHCARKRLARAPCRWALRGILKLIVWRRCAQCQL